MARRLGRTNLTAAMTVPLLVGLLLVQLLGGNASATHEPADKVSAAGATPIVSGPNEDVILLSERVKTAKPTDLILAVSLECVITTELTTVGNDSQTAEARVRVWIEIDGQPVLVSSDDSDGRVTFCDRLDQRETSMFDDEDATIRTLVRTGQANGFNWMTLDVGSGTHTIELHAELITSASETADAMAAIGKRTMIIEPTKAANDEDVTAIG